MSTPPTGGAVSRLALKQTPLDTWSTREHLALASAVLRSGDQNWMSVSRAMRGFADPGRPPDWFSQKNCAQQYARLLELVEAPRRKRERGEPNETPGESIVRKLRQDRTDELRRKVAETRAAYTALKAQIRQLRSGQLDAKLDEIQREIQAEKEAAAQEAERQRQWLEDREAQKLAVQQALRAQVTKAPPPKRRKLVLDPRESSPSEAGSVLSEPDLAESPASEPQPADVSGDEASRDSAEQRPAPASPLLTSLLRSPAGGRPSAAAATGTPAGAASEPGSSGPPAGSPALSRLLELPASTSGHALPRANLFPDSTPEQNGEPAPAAEQSSAVEVKQEQVEGGPEEEPPPPPAAEQQPEPVDPPVVAVETEVKSETPSDATEEVATAEEEPAQSEDAALVQPAPEPAAAAGAATATATAIATATATATATADTSSIEADADTDVATSCVTDEKTTPALEPAEDSPADKKPAVVEPETRRPSAGAEPKPASETASKEVKAESEPESKPKTKPAPEPAAAQEPPPEPPSEVCAEDGGGGGGEAPEALAPTPAVVKPLQAVVKQTPAVVKSPPAVVKPLPAVVKPTPADVKPPPAVVKPTPAVVKPPPALVKSPPAMVKPTSAEVKPPPAVVKSTPAEVKPPPAVVKPTPAVVKSPPAVVKPPPAVVKPPPAAVKPPPAAVKPTPAVVKQEHVEEEESESGPPPPPLARLASPAKDTAPVTDESTRRPPLPVKEERDESDAESAASVGPVVRARSSSARSEPASQPESVPNSPGSAVHSGDDEERRDYKLWKKSILLVWREFAGHRHASMFARPITNDQASNYSDIVKSPMDLALLKRNVEAGVVTSTPQFQRDLMLMFCNAMMFNSTDHEVYRFAREMQDECMEKLQLLNQSDKEGTAAGTRRETRESSRDEMKRKRSGDERQTPTRKRR